MGDQEEQDAIPADHGDSETAGCKMAWFGWMFLFGAIGILTTIGLQHLVPTWCERDEFRTNHGRMTDQMQQLGQGEINCLVDPDPRFIEELLADAASAAAVRDVYLGGDLSDPRLGRLRELPKLKCIVFLCVRHHNEFLRLMRGARCYRGVELRLHKACPCRCGSARQLSPLEIAGYWTQVSLHGPDGAQRQRSECSPWPSVAGTTSSFPASRR